MSWVEIEDLVQRYRCSYCNLMVASSYGFSDEEQLGDEEQHRTIYICPSCNNPTLIGSFIPSIQVDIVSNVPNIPDHFCPEIRLLGLIVFDKWAIQQFTRLKKEPVKMVGMFWYLLKRFCV